MAVDSIAYQGDVQEASKHIAMARKCLDGLRAKLGSSGATSASTQLRVSDLAYVVAIIGPGISKAVIVAGYGSEETQPKQYRAVSEVPDFVSGVALRSVIAQRADGGEEMATFWPTTPCAVAFGLSPTPAPIARLAVRADDALEHRWLETGPAIVPAQTMRVVPTMYSGKMCQVVQLLLGFGHEPESRYDRQQPLLTRYGRDAQRRQILPAYEQAVMNNGRQVLYDWSFSRTHGITTAPDGVLWLIEIGVQNGVLAMPLPINAVTKDPRFRQKLERMGDDAGLAALDTLTGWPTGEAFPTGEALVQAKRAGIVQQLLEPTSLAQLYDNHSPYSTAMGWSFNTRGTEAHVTAWRYGGDRIQRSVWWAVRLTIGATPETAPAPEARGVVRRIDSVQIGGDERRWLIAKANRMTRLQCQDVLERSSAAASLAALRALELDPMAPASATVRQMQEGKLYWPGQYQPWIQFPEPMLGYCVSHRMRQEFGPNLTAPPRCETVVHVLHHGDVLKTVSFLSDPRPAAPTDEDTFDDCLYQGSWRRTSSVGAAEVQTTMFTSDVDDRAEAHGYQTDETLTSVAIGYTTVQVLDDLTFPPLGQMRRIRTFRQVRKAVVESGPMMFATIRVPFFDRSAYYYASFNGWALRSVTTTHGYVSLVDPTAYTTWRNVPGYTTYSGLQPRGEHPAGCGPVTRRTVWTEQRADYACSDDADQGSWASPCDDAEAMVYSVELPPLPADSAVFANRQVRVSVRLYNATEQSPIAVATHEQIGMDTRDVTQWTATSPDPITFAKQIIGTTRNALGDRVQIQYDPSPNASASVVIGGPVVQLMREQRATFVGVV